jgi:hypothetical protein
MVRHLYFSLLALLCSSVQALVAGRVAAPRVAPGPTAVSAAVQIVMQVQAPAKTPTIQLAPTEPKKDADSAKGKKFKLLLFNDNMNKCALHAAGRPRFTFSSAQALMAGWQPDHSGALHATVNTPSQA